MLDQCFLEPRVRVIARFFQVEGKNNPFAAQVQQRIANSEQYTQNLKDSSLFVLDEEAERLGTDSRLLKNGLIDWN